MERAGIDMQLRVVVVTTRAAMRHAADNPDQRVAIIARGRSLVDSIASRAEGDDGTKLIDQALAELDSLVEE